MTAPVDAAARFGAACLLGAGLGLMYGFLRPLRPRWTVLADSVFVLAVWYCWLVLCFGICLGDIRLGYVMGLACGGLAWECSIGRWLRPVWYGFWRLSARIWETVTAPVRKILKKLGSFLKNLFAECKKWVTI